MPPRTKVFQQFPWTGGVNTALNAAQIPTNQLVQADNLVFDTRGSRKNREGINGNWDDGSSASDTIIGLADFWFGTATSKTQRLVALDDAKNFYSYESDGTRASITDSGTAYPNDINKCSMETIDNLLVIAVDGQNNNLKKWDGSGDIEDLGGSPPDASIVRKHLGRLWCNDLDQLDRLHYSETANAEVWNGSGDSGALDIGVGDGDPDGITAIFPTFKGQLFVAKKTKLYRISGFYPETFQVELISDGIGCSSHNSCVNVGNDDIFFVSERGVHSLAATDRFGDFESKFISKNIQKTFNDDFSRGALPKVWGAYLPTINSVAYTFSDSSTTGGISDNNAIWLYNTELGEWYRWPDLDCQCLISANDSDKRRFYFGSSTTRVHQTLTGSNNDTTEAGGSESIAPLYKTGVIFPDNTPYTMKAFKKISIIYEPTGDHTIDVTAKIDNAPNQEIQFTQDGTGAILGTDLVLGTSTLGAVFALAPYTESLDGIGRGIQLTFSQSGVDETAELQGFAIEYESAEFSQEVIEA